MSLLKVLFHAVHQLKVKHLWRECFFFHIVTQLPLDLLITQSYGQCGLFFCIWISGEFFLWGLDMMGSLAPK